MKNVLVCVGLVENRVAIKLCRPVLILREKLAMLRVQQWILVFLKGNQCYSLLNERKQIQTAKRAVS